MQSLHQRNLKMPIEHTNILNLPFTKIRDASTLRKTSAGDHDKTLSSFGRSKGFRIEISAPSDGYWDFIPVSDDIFLTITECRVQYKKDIVVQGEDLLKLRFLLHGSIQWKNTETIFDHARTTHVGPCTVLSYHPEGTDVQYRLGTQEKLSMLTLHCKRPFIEDLFSFRSSQEITSGPPSRGYDDQPLSAKLPLTRKIQLCINEILCSPYQGMTRLYFVRAKCTELLCIASSLLEENDKPTEQALRHVSLSRKDICRLEKVKTLMEADLNRWYSSTELCRFAGFNAKKLKYGFKKVFGKTPYQYVFEMRMDAAYKMIKEQNSSVSEVAYLLGYNYAANFTTAFKKHFGYTPKCLRGQIDIG